MVLTVTLNAALDLTYEAEHVAWGGVNRVDSVVGRAGGKGINVARTLQQLGRPVTVAGLAGGATGAAVREELAAAGLDHRLTSIAGDSRRTVTVHSRADAVVTALNEPGPEVSEEEWRGFLGEFDVLLEGASIAVLSGSLPRGVLADAYAQIAALCARHEVPAIVDASGPALVAALPAAPLLVKPNLSELQEAAGALGQPRVQGTAGVLEAAGRLRAGGAASVVASLGSAGVFALTEEGAWRAAVPRVRGNPIGAGDALVAALVDGWLAQRPWPERLRRAAAVGAASVRHPQAGGYDEAALAELEPHCEVELLARAL